MALTFRFTSRGASPRTSSGKATFSATVRSGRSLKSWKTTPMERRRYGTCDGFTLATLRPKTSSWPLVATSAQKTSRISVDLPAPEGPVRKTNSPFSIPSDTSSSAGASPGYCLWT